MARTRPILRTSIALGLFAATTALTIHAGYFRMFSFFASWDDEGYMLVSLRSFRAIGALYTEVYSQYGPFYFVVMDFAFDALRLPVTHDAGRLLTLGLWVCGSLLCGAAIARLSGSVGLGLAVQLLVFRNLQVLHFEPMHPGGLLAFLLCCVTLLPLLYPSRPGVAAALLGAVVAGASLVKINVGGFALLAVGLFFLTSLPTAARRRALLVGATLLAVATPPALMWAALGEAWTRRYALHVATAVLAVAAALAATGPADRHRAREVRICVAGGAVLALCVCAAVLLRGTRPSDLLDGVLVRPLGQAGALTIPLRLRPVSAIVDLLGLVLCAGFLLGRARGRLLEGALRVAAGVAMAVTASGLGPTGEFTSGFGFLTAPLAFVAVLAPRGLPSPPALAMARRLLPPLAVLQTLVAYPVAGFTQVQLGSFLLIPVGAITIADGARQLAVGPLATDGWPRRLAAAAAVLLPLAVVLRGVHIQLRAERALYESNVPLGLPGAARLRIPAAEAGPLRAVVAELRQHCETHVGLPSVLSLYLWAEQQPPTAANNSTWMFLFEPPLQARVVDRLRGIDRLCAVRSDELAAVFTQGRPVPPGPLADYFASAFTPAAQHGPFTFMVRR